MFYYELFNHRLRHQRRQQRRRAAVLGFVKFAAGVGIFYGGIMVIWFFCLAASQVGV